MSSAPPPPPPPRPARRPGLDVERIVDAALTVIAEDGLARLSMRRLGARLDVDPMAVYHHVPNKRELLALVMARVVGAMPLPAASLPWQARVREWAVAYWEVVATHRELVAVGLTDPVVASGGMPAVEPLRAAIAESGLDPALVDANVYLIVDAVHGSALARPQGAGDAERIRSWFDAGLDTVLAGIGARAEHT